MELIGGLTNGSIQGEVDHCDLAIESKRLSIPPDRSEKASFGRFSHLTLLSGESASRKLKANPHCDRDTATIRALRFAGIGFNDSLSRSK
jgi:hypothetical protein